MQHFPFPASREKATPQWTPKVDETKGCMTLGHSNWTIWSPRNLFLQTEFPLYYKAICSISLFLHAGERDTPHWTQKWMTLRGVWPWGIQIGPYGVQKTYFCKVNFHFINRPHAAFPFSCIQRKGHPSVETKSDDTKGCRTLGHSIWNNLSPQNIFLQSEFPLY